MRHTHGRSTGAAEVTSGSLTGETAMADLRPSKPRRLVDGGLMVTVSGFQSVTVGSPACCEGIDAASERLRPPDKGTLRQYHDW